MHIHIYTYISYVLNIPLPIPQVAQDERLAAHTDTVKQTELQAQLSLLKEKLATQEVVY